MRVANWNPAKADPLIIHASMNRLERLGEVIAQKARQRCPVGVDVPYGRGKWSGRKSGALKSSIRVVRLKGDTRRNVRVYAGSREVFYARFVEHGTVKMGAKPFLRPAVAASRGEAKSILLNGA